MKKLYRYFALALSLVLLLPCLVTPAAAEDFSWKDYIEDVDVSNGLITISLPANPTTFDVYPSGREKESFNCVQQLYYQFESYYETGMTYSLQITPSSGNFLYLGNIPDDTELSVELDIKSVINPEGDTVNGLPTIPAWNFTTARYNAHMYLFNEARERIAFRSMPFGSLYIPGENEPDELYNSDVTGAFYATTTLSDVLGNFEDTEYLDNALYFRASYFLEGMEFSAYTDCKISVQNYELTLRMDSLISDTGEYSDILEIILAALERRGETIDFLTGEIIRKPAPVRPSGSEVVDGVVKFDTDFAGSAASGYDNALVFSAGVADVVSTFGPGLLAASSLVDKAASLPFFDSILVISVSLGVFGLLVNLANQLISSSRASSDVRDKKKSKKGG